MTSDATPKCEHCGSTVPHVGKCPIIKSVEYRPDGSIRKVEYLTPADYYNSNYNWWPPAVYHNPPTTYGQFTVGIGR